MSSMAESPWMSEHPRVTGSTLLVPLTLTPAEFQDFSNTFGIPEAWIVMLLVLSGQWSPREALCRGEGGWGSPGRGGEDL